MGDLIAYQAASRDEPAIGRGIEASALRGTCVPFNNMHLPGQIGVQLSSTSEQSTRQVTTATADIGVPSVCARDRQGRGALWKSLHLNAGGRSDQDAGGSETATKWEVFRR